MTGALMSGGPYIIPNVSVEGSAIRNNNLQGGASRGYGINQAAISIETAMDMMAKSWASTRSSCAAAMLSTRARRRSAAKCSNTAWA